ncbi:hypothetical protein [Pseudomonas citronellolis]
MQHGGEPALPELAVMKDIYDRIVAGEAVDLTSYRQQVGLGI